MIDSRFGRPPVITTAALAEFVTRFEREVRPEVDHSSCKVVFGKRVDRARLAPMGKCWPYERLDEPLDWSWGLLASG